MTTATDLDGDPVIDPRENEEPIPQDHDIDTSGGSDGPEPQAPEDGPLDAGDG